MWDAFARHERIALSFSGGKDSTVALWLLREAGLLGRVTVYHLDTGDLFPEMVAHVEALQAWCPRFVHVRSDAKAWAAENGEPSDLVPYTSHEIGRAVGAGSRIASRYDCCSANLMRPIYDRIRQDGNTLVIRGTRRADMKRLPAASGDVIEGVEFLYPIQEWSDEQVFAFCAERGVPLPSIYGAFKQAPECATCPAWWSEGRAPYLKAHHPELFDEYQARVSTVMREVVPCLRHLMPMLEALK